LVLHVATVMLNPSEWMRVEHYFKAVKYFVSHMNLSKERPAVLLLYNNDLYYQLLLSITAKIRGTTFNLLMKGPRLIENLRQSCM
jgi:hypothetical protein